YNVDEGSRYRVGPINIEIKGDIPHMQSETKPASTDGLTAEPTTDQAKAIAEIEKLGGKVMRDTTSPGKPVVAVDFAPTEWPWKNEKFTDSGLQHLKGFAQLQSLN